MTRSTSSNGAPAAELEPPEDLPWNSTKSQFDQKVKLTIKADHNLEARVDDLLGKGVWKRFGHIQILVQDLYHEID